VPLKARRHVFTHFTLEFQPFMVDLDERPASIGEAVGDWLSLDQLAGAALPAPIRSLLGDLRSADESAQSTFF
jgi:adenine-specific DNA glycosylase